MPAKKLIGFCFLMLVSLHSAVAQEAKLVLPIGITNDLYAVSYSPDGKLIVTDEYDAIKIWNAATGKLLSEFKDSSGVFDAQFQADSKKILVASSSDTIRILDAVTAKAVTIIKVGSPIETAAFSPRGNMVLTISKDSIARIWNSATKQKVIQVRLDNNVIEQAAFSPGGDKFYILDERGSLLLWDIKTNKSLLRIKNNSKKSVAFNTDGTKMAISSADTIKLWKLEPGKIVRLSQFQEPQDVVEVKFSPDGSRIATASGKMVRVRNAVDHSFLYELKYEFGEADIRICFSPDGQKILTQDTDTAKVWNGNTGAFLFNLKGEYGYLDFQSFSPDGKRILAVPGDPGVPLIWDARNGIQTASLEGHTTSINVYEVSKNGNRALLEYWDNGAKLFDATTGKLLRNYDYARMSPDRSLIIAFSNDSTIELLDAETGNVHYSIPALSGERNLTGFSPDGKKIFVLYTDGNLKIWDIAGKTMQVNVFLGDSTEYHMIDVSPDNTKFLAGSIMDGQVKIWDIQSGKLLQIMDPGDFFSARFNADGEAIITVTDHIFQSPMIWDLKTGDIIKEFPASDTTNVTYSSGRKKILLSSKDKGVSIFNSATGALQQKLKYKYADINRVDFNGDDNNLVIVTKNGKLIMLDLVTGKETIKPAPRARFDRPEWVTADEKYFICPSYDLQKIERWDIAHNKLMFSFFAVDSADYLVTDGFNHYDGSDEARKLLYFTCGTEVIELDQVKDQLWVPNLAERILNGDTINAKTLKELNICGLTPEVEEANSKEESYNFKITPRRGGLGETVLYINGIEAKRFLPGQLIKTGGAYELIINKAEFAGYFISGAENLVTVKAYTSDNTISSRGLRINEDKTKEDVIPPNLYAVMVGVSDYKGEELDLKYAAKDATDISSIISNVAQKLLNIDGVQHVFMYNLTTEKDHYQLPEKKGIKKILDDIGKKATANDILLIFFSGHGVMTDLSASPVPASAGASATTSKKQFYFLTADASPASVRDAVADVGISTNELTEWIKPQQIKAQKRILIFDACNSGQAINDFAKLGKEDQGYMAGKSDDKDQQIKAIDKLNERSGLFILSASASNQNAYELGRYSQGLLTYSLLRAIKLKPDILNNGKYLDLSRWFNAAKETVISLSRDNGARQEPQIITNTNFNIGIVDDEVLAKIMLASEKPIVASSIFINIEANDDDLELSKKINRELADISSDGADSKIVYVTGSNLPEAYSLTGSYEVKGNIVTVKVNVKQDKKIKYSFEVSGAKEKLGELVSHIVEKAGEAIK